MEQVKRASVAVVLWNEGGYYLMQRTGCKHYRDMWGLPGGKIQVGERTIDAAIREVYEETGLKIEPHRLWHLENNDVEDEFLCAIFHASLRENEKPLNTEPEKHSDWVLLTNETLGERVLIPGLKPILLDNF